MPKTLSNKPPKLWWTLTEPRAVIDLASFYAARRRLKKLPKGDGHPVMVMPGFLSNDGATVPLRSLLRDLGYRTYGWGQGQNRVIDEEVLGRVTAKLKRTYAKNGRKVSLIGWSLGGVVAREMAKRNPDIVRAVITLGSPISGQFEHTPAYKIYTSMNGLPSEEDQEFYLTIKDPPPVPCTSIYSKSDGIIAWRHSLQEDTPLTENIQIGVGHFGMGVSPVVMKILADRLAQPDGKWTKYKTGLDAKKKPKVKKTAKARKA